MSCTQSIASGGKPSCRHGVASAGTERRLRQAAVAHILHTLALWFGRARQRRDLAELDAHLLKDVGLTPYEARRESAKPFWVE
jgi:uncharacterized protein YjiS (DUF1127 family)